MLTRLKIKGFKNLDDTDILFSTFTCIAGHNGVGKSNVFDAIKLLSSLAEKPLLEAALGVRGTNGRLSDLSEIFSKGNSESIQEIDIEADIITPLSVFDEYGRKVSPKATYLTYKLKIEFDSNKNGGKDGEPIYITHESLDAKDKKLENAYSSLLFLPQPYKKNNPNEWLKKFIKLKKNRRTPYISTTEYGSIKLHSEDEKFSGRPSEIIANKSPRTRLSGVNTEEHATALAARREMQSWRLLQLEPSALRRMDDFRDLSSVSITGAHLPNSLLRIGNHAEIAKNLAELIPGIVDVNVNSDDTRQLRSLSVVLKDKLPYAASSLSDGTLRFLALAIMANDTENSGLLCMEEPENGIHPERIEPMLNLVKNLTDSDFETPIENDIVSIRQVIINTHSPLVVGEVNEEDLIMAHTIKKSGIQKTTLKPITDTWRSIGQKKSPVECISKGAIGSYLGHTQKFVSSANSQVTKSKKIRDSHTVEMFE